MSTQQPNLELAERPPQASLSRETGPIEAENLEQLLVRGMNDPTFDVTKLERLGALLERRDLLARKERFDNALAECQMKMPRVAKNGLIDMGSKGSIPYARLEDLDTCIRPIYGALGFSVRYDAPVTLDGGKIRFIAKFACAGVTEQIEITLPPDQGPGRSAVQAVKASITAGRRHLLEMFFNIIEEGADEANQRDMTPITQDQADTLRAKVDEVNGNMAGFLKLMRVNRLEDLKKSQLDRAYTVIEEKRKR